MLIMIAAGFIAIALPVLTYLAYMCYYLLTAIHLQGAYNSAWSAICRLEDKTVVSSEDRETIAKLKGLTTRLINKISRNNKRIGW